MAAEHATIDNVAFFLNSIGIPLRGHRRATRPHAGSGLMVPTNTERHRTAYLVSADYTPATTTGISAGDRAATVRALADPHLGPPTSPGRVSDAITASPAESSSVLGTRAEGPQDGRAERAALLWRLSHRPA
jgi:3,4-dihydroxy-2-butanone 4-phosphate synthase